MIDAILIDDDSLVHLTWRMSAKQHGKVLETFTDPQSFMLVIDRIDKTTPIYIDSNLSGGIKGELVAKDIFAAGFLNIYLATGEPAGSFPAMAWIKKILGKTPPWV